MPPLEWRIDKRRLRSTGKVLVQGTTSNDGTVAKVTVNGLPANSTRGDFAEWEITLEVNAPTIELTAEGFDAAGNRELTPHVSTRGR
jgi:hypothetical protein